MTVILQPCENGLIVGFYCALDIFQRDILFDQTNSCYGIMYILSMRNKNSDLSCKL